MSFTMVAEPYPEKLFDIPRFMCPQCGLIFDNLLEFGNPGSFADEFGWDDDYEVFCPRCKLSFDKSTTIPIVAQKTDLSSLSMADFFVEDRIHRLVIEQMAHKSGKRVMIQEMHNASNVELFFKFSVSQGGLLTGYFVIDGDNKRVQNSSDPHFLHLERYCMENYLLDFDVCAAVKRLPPEEIQTCFSEIVSDGRGNLSKGDRRVEFFIDRFLVAGELEPLLTYVNLKSVFAKLLKEFGMTDGSFISEYVSQCYACERFGYVLPRRLVEMVESLESLRQ